MADRKLTVDFDAIRDPRFKVGDPAGADSVKLNTDKAIRDLGRGVERGTLHREPFACPVHPPSS